VIGFSQITGKLNFIEISPALHIKGDACGWCDLYVYNAPNEQ